jgi:tetratricopeptide (TPR) repeat protein
MKWKVVITGIGMSALMLAADPAVDSAKKKLAEKKYDDAIATLETAQKAKPKSTDISKALSEAYTTKADSLMADANLPPRQKYPEALRAYRKAVLQDKTNKKAQDNITTIEGIYKQMGRPVPQ